MITCIEIACEELVPGIVLIGVVNSKPRIEWWQPANEVTGIFPCASRAPLIHWGQPQRSAPTGTNTSYYSLVVIVLLHHRKHWFLSFLVCRYLELRFCLSHRRSDAEIIV